MSAGSAVTIAGRAFPKPRRLLGHSTDSPLPGGRVTFELVPSGTRRIAAGTEWAAWAGEPVEDER